MSVFVMLIRRAPGLGTDASRRGEREILGAFIAEVDLATKAPSDPVREVVIIGPRRDLEERWDFFLSGL